MSTLKRYNGTSWENVGGNIAPKTARTTSSTDTYTCDYINALSDYSTNETVIGRWIDGKPIYRKVYKITSGISVDTEHQLDVSSLNIDKCIKLEGFTYDNYFKHIDLIFYNNDWSYMFLGGNNIVYKYHWSASEIYIIIEYTKSTD